MLMTATATIVGIEPRSLAAGSPVQILHLELTVPFEFDAGQYLEVVHPDGTTIPLSIVSPPERLPSLALHYRSTPGLVEAERMDSLLETGRLSLRGGIGEVRLAGEDASPLFLVAGGTGISQALCLASAQCKRHPTVSVTLLACADTEADLYFHDLLSEAATESASGFSAELIADDVRDENNRALVWLKDNAYRITTDHRVVLCGSPAFVYAATDTMVAAGVDQKLLESDVYAWASR